MQGIRYQYSALYTEFAEQPELTRFRRYTKESAWMLYNQNAAIKRLIDECNAEIREIQGPSEGGATVFTVTDLHLSQMCEDYPQLGLKVDKLTKGIRTYLKDLRLVHSIAQLPDQSPLFSKRFANIPNLCEDKKFGPTGESDEYYKDPPHADTCTLREPDPQDSLTNLFIDNIEAIVSKFSRKKVDPDSQRRESIKLSTICRAVNLIVGLYASVVFTVSIAIFHLIRATSSRIVVAGLFGVLFSMSSQLLIPGIKRGEIFAIIAAYFAIAGVFIGASDNGGC